MNNSEERGWLIERHINGQPYYWNGRSADRSVGFTPDPNSAIRFARQQDASYVLSWMLQGEGRATEHMWVDRSEDKR